MRYKLKVHTCTICKMTFLLTAKLTKFCSECDSNIAPPWEARKTKK